MNKKYLDAQKSAILVGGGEIYESDAAIARDLDTTVFCADSGAQNALRMGLKPNTVIGDLDSYKPAAQSKVTVIQTPDQNYTDFEKALGHIEEKVVYCFGFWGKRLDHSLAALSVIAKTKDTHVILFSEQDICFRAPERLRLPMKAENPIAFFPMSCVTAKSVGLRYNFDSLALSPVGTISTSNTAIDTVELKDVEGDLLVVLPKDFLEVAVAALSA